MLLVAQIGPSSLIVAVLALALIFPARRSLHARQGPVAAFAYTLAAALLACSVIFAEFSLLLSIVVVSIPVREWTRGRLRRMWTIFRGRAYLLDDTERDDEGETRQ